MLAIVILLLNPASFMYYHMLKLDTSMFGKSVFKNKSILQPHQNMMGHSLKSYELVVNKYFILEDCLSGRQQ